MRLTAWHGFRAAGLAVGVLGLLAAPAHAASPPPQPAQGPGGAGDRAATIVKRALGRASAATFAFYKSGPAPAEGRPVVVFLHAWGAPNPQSYGGWIDHLAREGNLVLFPRFQEVNRTRPADATANVESLVKAALAELASDPDGKPDPKRVAIIGHLAGAPLAANVAAAAGEQGLPAPKLVFAVMPGGIASNPKSRGIPLKDLASIPADTLVVTVIGDKDARAADAAARRILREASAVPPERKLFVRALSDDHGFPAMTATLAAPAGVDSAYDGGAIKLPPDQKDQKAPPFKWSADMALSGEQQTLVSQINNARTDALDYLAFWKTFDLAAAAAFSGADAASLKNNARFSDMERWTDGWPVKRLAVETPKAAPPPAATPAASGAPPAARNAATPTRR
ncbi:alpha/beta hydrolase fold domain-containing protein [Methylobacterium oxalidis]|uniref:Uncharacterized protein n=1 Tax=Methylobacterium oxalidis TaxID=944322 RepID=A0A512J543_9HYPH|nr:alpha/beta hydrolase fold domain-containing protein [Methylobacterium oxalidis]GEP05081.1 hypothetical protein MOX02_31190 [Methylobacterium oxalidis]GJE34775.1 hypothetical protein LDDCCGHA_4990 [Methylobacterium oxalidis]GLS65640.1 hypothetical protein GCM10007888_40220 [Methylobacterium oxalidis]